MLCDYFLFTETATTEISTLPLHDALPICPTTPAPRRTRSSPPPGTFDRPPRGAHHRRPRGGRPSVADECTSIRGTASGRPSIPPRAERADRKSTRLNSSHTVISYAVFCLKKKNKKKKFLKKIKKKKQQQHLKITGPL